MKRLMLIGNVVVYIPLCLEGLDNFFSFLSEVIWLAPSLLSHFNWLGDLKQNLVHDSNDGGTSTESKPPCPPEGYALAGNK